MQLIRNFPRKSMIVELSIALCALCMSLAGCAQISTDAYYEPESNPRQWNCDHWNGSESCRLKVNDSQIYLDIGDRAHHASWVGVLVPFIPVGSGHAVPDPDVLDVALCWHLKLGAKIDIHVGDINVVQSEGNRLQPEEIADRVVRDSTGTLNKHLVDEHSETLDSKCTFMLFKSNSKLDEFTLALPTFSVDSTAMTPEPLLMHLENGTHYDFVGP